jgi:outer membrane protein W
VEYKKVKSDSLQTETELYDETLNYIEIPVLFHYSFLSDSSAFRPRVFFGPSLNVRASSNRNLSYKKVNAADSVLLESTADQDLKNTYTPLDYGFIVGAGVTYKINSKFVATADVRLNYGLMDIREYLSESSPSIRNRNYCFHIGVYYLLGQ